MMIVFTLILWRASSVMPRERRVGLIGLMHVVVDGRAGGARGVVQRRVDGALGAHALAVGALYRAPAAVRVVQTLRTLLKSITRLRTLVLVRFGQHQTANSSRTVHRLICGRYAFS